MENTEKIQIIGINQDKCIKCGKCVKDCPSTLFLEKINKENGNTVIFEDPLKNCIKCGHCLAICPTQAINYSNAEKCINGKLISNPQEVPYENILELLRSRRSIRQYKNKPLIEEDLMKVLDSMRYAPSASNKQSWEFVVITDKKKITEFSKKIIKIIKLSYRLIRNSLVQFFVRFGELGKQVQDPSIAYEMKMMIDKDKNNEDPIFFNAPCIVVLHSPNYGNMAGNDAGISLTYAMLAAQSLGIGSCWIGMAQETMLRTSGLNKWLKIPKKRKVWGILTLGYPKIKYERAPPRNSLNFRRI